MKLRKGTDGSNAKRASGVSLVELLVAVAIGLILIASLTYSFVATRATFRAQEAQARKFENGRMALEAIVRDLRLASKMGCHRVNGADKNSFIPLVTLTATYPVLYSEAELTSRGFISTAPRGQQQRLRLAGRKSLDARQFVRAYDSGVGYTNHSGASRSPLPNTDVLLIIKGGESGSHLVKGMTNPNQNFLLQNRLPGAAPGSDTQLFVVTDCQSTEIVRARINKSSAASGGDFDHVGLNQVVNGIAGLTREYGPEAYVTRFEPVIYMVAQPPASSQVSTPYLVRYGLRNAGDWDVDPEIIADGIEDLQIRYGVTSRDGREVADEYVPASGVTDWDAVISVEVTLVAISKEDRVGVVDSTSAGGATDRRLRQTFSTVVQLRNRPRE